MATQGDKHSKEGLSMSSVAHVGPSHLPYASHRETPVARVRSHTESTQSSLTLKVRTAEGDTVELSFDATTLKQLESGRARSSHNKASYSSASESVSFSFNAKVTGDLNDQELSDIAKLIQSLETGQAATAPLSSLDAYSGAFQQTTQVSDSTVRLYG
jgi:hypothetical protein